MSIRIIAVSTLSFKILIRLTSPTRQGFFIKTLILKYEWKKRPNQEFLNQILFMIKFVECLYKRVLEYEQSFSVLLVPQGNATYEWEQVECGISGCGEASLFIRNNLGIRDITKKEGHREVIAKGLLYYIHSEKGENLFLAASSRAVLTSVTLDPCGNEKMPIIEEYYLVKRGKCNGASISLYSVFYDDGDVVWPVETSYQNVVLESLISVL